ncbi:bifunctional adenosylcobinamide kinase/adenosylcobinamide-phosphate guanylyltransferase [Paenibacillus gallinarum]|uniref:Adenosylcobinamide kinase n=1 Tax=Paenibacillus gallinarum TaxID=2762232 RepID=A0ABR8SSY3_9BACL|nr:bifunctional adenosylcobinamide kinase/adenosylcobinamide-phosphate guanylyltransferase [Paenibacillus gallinarum]MBD7966609.1 bifunctional adenosylcobinamide kinase/adenosylcobinamide-phosphate guanylyltransferase [Paenibacillus gallinarum]
MIILVTGGARSGKSTFAEKLCMSRSSEAIYMATAQAYDQEMTDRIAAHRSQREDGAYLWHTIEEPLEVAETLDGLMEATLPVPTILLDCLTLWLSNVLIAKEHEGPDAITEEIDRLVRSVAAYPGLIILVTNEVGDGIVPEYRLGRIYRDYAGILNQRMAAISQEIFLVTAGIAIELKSKEYKV